MFSSILQRLRRLFHDEEGPTAVEYAVMLALIIVVCLGTIRLIGSNASSKFNAAANALNPKTDGNEDGNGQI